MKPNPKEINLQHSSTSIAIAGYRGEVQVVKDALGADDPELRITALGAALRLKILDGQMLQRGLTDPAWAVRRRAAELVPRSGAGEAVELIDSLVSLLDDDACAEVAAFALGELGVSDTRIASALQRQARHHDDPLCRESAIAALGTLGVGRSTVIAALDDVATVRRRAVISLANFSGVAVEAAIRRALDDRDWQVRQAAEDLLG